VLGLDNFNNYYDPLLKKAREARLRDAGSSSCTGTSTTATSSRGSSRAFTSRTLRTWQPRPACGTPWRTHSRTCTVTWRGLCRCSKLPKATHQPAIVWASSSSVYGTNRRVPFSESHRRLPASLYAATKKAGEVIAHTYNHIYGLSITGLRFFTVYGPWGRPTWPSLIHTRHHEWPIHQDLLRPRAM